MGWQSASPGSSGDMTKAVYDPNADGVIAKAQLDTALANTSGTNTGDQTLAGLGGVAHSLATAVNDMLVASGVGAFVKKTLAEVKTILDWAADIATHAALSATHGRTNIDGVTERDSAISSHAGGADPHPVYAFDTDLTTHAALTTGVHGVEASTVETVAGSQAKVDARLSAANATDLTDGGATTLHTHQVMISDLSDEVLALIYVVGSL